MRKRKAVHVLMRANGHDLQQKNALRQGAWQTVVAPNARSLWSKRPVVAPAQGGRTSHQPLDGGEGSNQKHEERDRDYFQVAFQDFFDARPKQIEGQPHAKEP